MAGFDPSKDAINLAKHGISLARWVDLDILAVVNDDLSSTANRVIAVTD